MENSVTEGEVGSDPGCTDVDSFNDETFGGGAIQGDWETSHYVMTGDAHGGSSPQLPLSLQQVESGQIAEGALPDVAQLKIKELWPSTPQANPHDSIWSSPELPTKERSSPQFPPGSKIMSVEELEREMTNSSPSSASASMSPRPQPHPFHALSPSPSHQLPPPGIIQHPPPGLPHPLPPRQMHHFMPWPLGAPPPRVALPLPSAFLPFSPPRVPIMRPGILIPGHLHQPPYPLHPPFPPPHQMHPLFHHHHHQPPNFAPSLSPRKSKRSEYLDEMQTDGSGFMTQKEKDWVIKIQLIQLHTTDPDEDYYYQNYLKRKQLGSNQPPTPNRSALHDPEDSSPDHTPTSGQRLLPEFTARSYKPKEFQGTLGKLTVSSIAAPRKTIDVPLSMEGSGKDVGGAGMDTHTKKRQALAIIENLYSAVLMLEELEKKALTHVEEGKQAQLVAKKEEVTAQVFAQLKLKPAHETSTRSDAAVLLMVAGYRKGKRAIKRVLPFLNNEQACAVILVILRYLPLLIKKDNDQVSKKVNSECPVLPELTIPVTSVLTSIDLEMANKCLCAALEGPSISSNSLINSPSAIIRVCSSEFGADVLLALVRQGQEQASGGVVDPSEVGERSRERWSSLLKHLYDVIDPQRAKLSSATSSSTHRMLQFLDNVL